MTKTEADNDTLVLGLVDPLKHNLPFHFSNTKSLRKNVRYKSNMIFIDTGGWIFLPGFCTLLNKNQFTEIITNLNNEGQTQCSLICDFWGSACKDRKLVWIIMDL